MDGVRFFAAEARRLLVNGAMFRQGIVLVLLSHDGLLMATSKAASKHDVGELVLTVRLPIDWESRNFRELFDGWVRPAVCEAIGVD